MRMLSKKRGGIEQLAQYDLSEPSTRKWLPLRMRNMKRGGAEREKQNCINLPWLQILQL